MSGADAESEQGELARRASEESDRASEETMRITVCKSIKAVAAALPAERLMAESKTKLLGEALVTWHERKVVLSAAESVC